MSEYIATRKDKILLGIVHSSVHYFGVLYE